MPERDAGRDRAALLWRKGTRVRRGSARALSLPRPTAQTACATTHAGTWVSGRSASAGTSVAGAMSASAIMPVAPETWYRFGGGTSRARRGMAGGRAHVSRSPSPRARQGALRTQAAPRDRAGRNACGPPSPFRGSSAPNLPTAGSLDIPSFDDDSIDATARTRERYEFLNDRIAARDMPSAVILA